DAGRAGARGGDPGRGATRGCEQRGGDVQGERHPHLPRRHGGAVGQLRPAGAGDGAGISPRPAPRVELVRVAAPAHRTGAAQRGAPRGRGDGDGDSLAGGRHAERRRAPHGRGIGGRHRSAREHPPREVPGPRAPLFRRSASLRGRRGAGPARVPRLRIATAARRGVVRRDAPRGRRRTRVVARRPLRRHAAGRHQRHGVARGRAAAGGTPGGSPHHRGEPRAIGAHPQRRRIPAGPRRPGAPRAPRGDSAADGPRGRL
ncbi:MAG: NAD-dependent protein deacetylase of SIR2 family, partial [uncultured Gemmatimonadetes bacterium]